jgi:GT2 family glycosyltransferase/glycosyltransferase involved in cell wall biosynthesis
MKRVVVPKEKFGLVVFLGQVAATARTGLFDAAYYRRTYPDITGSDSSLLLDFFQDGWEQGRRPNFYFDPLWYALQNGDVSASGLNPLYHYAFHGEKEGRRAAPLFDNVWYRKRYGLKTEQLALRHWLINRTACRFSPIPEFDIDFYMQQSQELVGAGIDPFEHFWTDGFRLDRNPSRQIDLRIFKDRYLSGVAAENPFAHWLERRHNFRALTTATRLPIRIATERITAARRGTSSAIAAEHIQDVRRAVLTQAVEDVSHLKQREAKSPEELHLRFPPFAIAASEAPLATIIVPVFNHFELTYDCVCSMVQHLPTSRFEIVLVDDASSDATMHAQALFKDTIRVLRTPRNSGFLAAANFGAAEARGKYLYFLNNDTLVQAGWLDALVDTVAANTDIGVVGSRLLSPDGRVQEVGGVVLRDASAGNWGRGTGPECPQMSHLRDVDYVSGAALLTRATLFRALGGFDKSFEPAYYEDTDYCFRIRNSGYRVVVQPASTIVHLEGRSHGTDPGSGLKAFQRKNQAKFWTRWRAILSSHGEPGEVTRAQAYRYAPLRALFIDAVTLTPDQDAGSNAALSHIKILQQLGYHVTFLPAEQMTRQDPYTSELEKGGVECWHLPFARSVEQYFEEERPRLDLIYVHRSSVMAFVGHLCKKYHPETPLLFSLADLHGLRELREAKLLRSGRRAVRAAMEKLESELQMMAAADCVVVHSSFEEDMIRQMMPAVNVRRVPWTVNAALAVPEWRLRSDIGFVGGFAHSPNVDAVDWFLCKVWPRLSQQLDNARFVILGSKMPERYKDMEGQRVDALGHVLDLSAKLAALRVTVAPLRYGAGVKGKVLTSMAAGVPCVMTSIAAEGLGLTGDLLQCVASHPTQMSGLVQQIYQDEALWVRLSSAGRKFIAAHYSAAAATKALNEGIASARAANSRPRGS